MILYDIFCACDAQFKLIMGLIGRIGIIQNIHIADYFLRTKMFFYPYYYLKY